MKSITIPCTGYEIAADWYDGKKDEVLLVLIGFTSSKKKYEDMAASIIEGTGMAALVVDYSGHGESPFDIKNMSPAENFIEVVAAFDWLVKNHPDKKISVMGTSYGGFHATQLTKYRSFEKLILRVPALYDPKDFYTKWSKVDDGHAYRFREDFNDYSTHPLLSRAATNFDGKAFVIQHENDDICPHNSTQAFADAFKAKVWRAPRIGHGLDDISQEDYIAYKKRVIDWLNQ